MDAKAVAPETMPHDSKPSSVGDGGGEEEVETAAEKPTSSVEAPQGLGFFLSPMPKSVSDDDVGGGDEIVGDERVRVGGVEETSERAVSFLSPIPKSVSADVGGGDEIGGGESVTDLKDVGEVEEIGGEGFMDKVVNGSVGFGEDKVAIGKPILGEIEDESLKKSEEDIVKEVGGVEKLENENSAMESDEKNSGELVGDGFEQKETVINGKASVNDAEYKIVEEESVKFTDEGDSIVDSSTMESVDVDVAKPGVVVVGAVEESKVNEVVEKEALPEKIVEVDEKNVVGSEAETSSEWSVEKVDVKPAGEELDSIVNSSVMESVHVDTTKPEIVVVGDLDGNGATEVEDKQVFAVEKGVEMQNKFDHINGDLDDKTDTDSYESVEEGESVVDSSVMESVHVDVANPSVVIVGDIEETKEAEYTQTDLEAEEPDDLTAAYDGNVELLAENIVETAKETLAEQNDDAIETKDHGDKSLNKTDLEAEEMDDLTAAYDGNAKLVAENIVDSEKEKPGEQKNDVTEAKDHDDKSSNVDLGEKDEKLVAEAETEINSETDADVVQVVSRDQIQVEDTVSKRGFGLDGEGVEEVSGTDEEENEEMMSDAAKQFLEELEKASSGLVSHSGTTDSIIDQSQRTDGQIVTDSDEEADTDEEGEDGRELFDSAALAALLKAATGSSNSDGGSITISSQDAAKLFSVERPAGLGSSLRSIKPAASRTNRPNVFSHQSVVSSEETEVNLSEEEKQKLEKLQSLRVKFLRLVHKLGHSAEDSIAAQVLYRLALLAGRQTGQIYSLETAKKTAMELESEESNDIDFSLTILVLGKAGVGKSATINSILADQKASIDAFEPATTAVREITGTVDGVKIRILDTPGLKSSAMEQNANRKLLSSIKKVTKKCPPDIVLYVDRLDSQTRDLNDLPLLRTITSVLGSSIWKNAIVTLTHAASAPPDGPSGSPLSYEVFVAQRSHIVQQSVGQGVGDLRLMNPGLMNPVSLVENHPSCRKNRDGQKVLPNGQTWRPQLLLLCYSMKILSEAAAISKPQDPVDQRRLFGLRVRSPPLPYLLSWLLQSRTHPKLPTDQGGDGVDSDIDIDDMSDSDHEDNEEDEYDQLPPFKPLKKSQLAKLSREQKRAYLEEYDYRVKLLQKKQWKEELKRMKGMKKKGKSDGAESEIGFQGEEEDDPENGAPASVPVPLPDMVLPPSFDGDNPAFRYRFLEPTSQLLTRPVLDTHGWDHDCGYDGVNVEHSVAFASRFPAAVSVQVTKDKKDFSIHLDSSVSAKHGENGSTMAGFDIQNVGKQLAYVVRGETKFKNLRKNKMGVGGSVTFLGENIATGVKVEDQIAVGKRIVLVGSTGTVRSKDDAAYGANLEIRLREADFPVGQDQSSLGLSLVKWRGDLALGANLQSQISVGRNSKVAIRAGLNNKMSGQISLKTSSSDQLQIALTAFLPVFMAVYKTIRPGTPDSKYSMY